MASYHCFVQIVWPEIVKNLNSVNQTPIIFFDMDGVLADFFGAFSSYCGVSHWKELKHEELMQKIDSIKGTDFFSRIPKTWCCDELIDFASNISGGFSILSSPLDDDEDNCAHWKRVWIEQELMIKPDEIFIQRNKGELAQYRGKPNILIDDRPHNIEDWKNNGGNAIRFQANEDPIEVVTNAVEEIYKLDH